MGSAHFLIPTLKECDSSRGRDAEQAFRFQQVLDTLRVIIAPALERLTNQPKITPESKVIAQPRLHSIC